jgi:hypothetical protein
MPAIWAFLKLVPWWVWPMAALGTWGWYEQGRADRHEATLDRLVAEQMARDQVAEETTKILKAAALRSKERSDAEAKRIVDWLAARNRLLMSRPERPADGGSTPACPGASGAELYRQDGQFLAGEAAAAEDQRRGLGDAYERIDALTTQLRICRGQ